MNISNLILLTLLLVPFLISNTAAKNTCSYTTYKWNVDLKKAVEFKSISHSYSSIERHEIDPKTGCTVCEEDQELIEIADIPAFKVCSALAPKISKVLNDSYHNGFPFKKVVGYRVGMTRGEVDENGNRTQFSNHSFGIAIDINEDQNGLYDQCIEFSDQCRLRKGGIWNPEIEGTLTINGQIVNQMKDIGFKWGGEIKGRQKDFMHFSLTGY